MSEGPREATSPTRSAAPALPTGQRIAPLRRFGLPWFAPMVPAPPALPTITVGGTVRRPTQLTVPEVMRLADRATLRADLHCVTTWTATGLCWGGVPFAAVLAYLTELVRPHRDVRWVTLTGLDGYRACLRLDDATAPDVLLADTLDGAPLDLAAGAPVRLVAPEHYGYKSVRHVAAIDFRTRYDSGSAGWLAHPRARVAREERSRGLPGVLWRPVWRWSQPRVRRRYDRYPVPPGKH
ncbi:molybdopterin-dependent oxidoreductase [Plantactinospora sp. GCM10030261]|uniref:molybdopterin-dependent oxidoreductase n=1 Tax=Plantactinospora sp. GCM10030261 TaxID=3273420 RepID=UPI00361F1CBE